MLKNTILCGSILGLLVFSSLGSISYSFSTPFGSGNSQYFELAALDDKGIAMSNVTIQGLYQIPYAPTPQFATVFYGSTNAGGIMKVTNLTPTKKIANEWNRYLENHPNDAFAPYIVTLYTFNYGGSYYTYHGSIDLTPIQILDGKGLHLGIRLSAAESHKLVSDMQVGKIVKSAGGHFSSVYKPSLTYKFPRTIGGTGIDSGYYYWGETNSSYINGTNGNWIQMPMAVTQSSGDAIAQSYMSITATSQSETASLINPFSNKYVEVENGPTNGQISSNIYQAVNFYGGTTKSSYNYVYMNMTGEIVNYEMYYYTGLPLNDYQTLTGIYSIENSNSNIITRPVYGQPSFQSSTQQYYQYNLIDSSLYSNWRDGSAPYPWNNLPLYDFNTTTLYADETNYATMAGIAIGIGSIALAIATDGVSLALEAAIAGISVSALGTALGFIQWGSSNSWDVTSGIHFWNTVDQPIQFYLDTSLIPFQVSTAGGNVNVTVNIANAFVYGQTPPSSGGGGGCVLNGTIVSLANGTTVLIQNLRPGMKTVSYDPITHRLFTSTVDSVNETNVTMIMDINHGSLYVSGMNDQPIFVKLKNGTEEWLTLDQLNYGMELFNPQKHTWTLITSISLQFGNFSVYDVQTVPNIHDQGHLRGDYIANGFLLDKKIG